MSGLKVAVIFGGCSEEHAVSVRSATEVATHLDPERYDPIYVGITPAGAWKLCSGPDTGWAGDERLPTAVLSPDRRTHGLLVFGQGPCEAVRLDVVLPVLHGTLGEDGAIQGLLELSGIPYVGCGIDSSALCMDKSLTYLVATSVGVAVPRSRIITVDDEIDLGPLQPPFFVKPARSGSSFGVSRACDADEMVRGVAAARQYDSKVVIEEAVGGSEVGCAVLGSGDDLLVGEPDRVVLSNGFLRIHQERHPEQGSENATFVVPADIGPEARALIRDTARTLYRAMGCRGLARVDLFLTDDGTVVLNEINTFPGLTPYSRYPRMMAAAGLSLGEVLDRLLALAVGER